MYVTFGGQGFTVYTEHWGSLNEYLKVLLRLRELWVLFISISRNVNLLRTFSRLKSQKTLNAVGLCFSLLEYKIDVTAAWWRWSPYCNKKKFLFLVCPYTFFQAWISATFFCVCSCIFILSDVFSGEPVWAELHPQRRELLFPSQELGGGRHTLSPGQERYLCGRSV